jgi:predicted ABC-type ATPase
MWLIAGANGAGNSSFAENFMADLNHINLDIGISRCDRKTRIGQKRKIRITQG